MSKPQEVELNEDTLKESKEALDFYDEMDKEERLDSLDDNDDNDDNDEDDDEDDDEKDTSVTKLEGELSRLEDLLRPYGGAEGAARALEIVKTSPEYQAVTERLIKGGGEDVKEDKDKDDPDIDPQLKKAHAVIDKRIERLLGQSIKQVEAKIDSRMKPLSDDFRQTKLETIEVKMISTYGKDTYKSLEKDMDKVLKDYPANYLDNPSFKKIDDVFHTAMRRAGKAEKFYQQQSQEKIKGKKEKTTGNPGTSGNSEGKLELRDVKSIEDALFNAELKAKHGVSNRENANSRVRSKKFKTN